MSTEKQISEIIIRYFNGNLNSKEKKELIQWLELSEENKKYFAQKKDLWEVSLKNKSQLAETDKEWIRFHNKITSQENPGIKKTFRLRYWQGAAAILIIALLTRILTSLSFQNENQLISAIVPLGSMSQLLLPDSTLVYINAGSELQYSLNSKNKNQREVFLKGEAYFDVRKDEKKPFVVHTPAYNIRVTGTRFNVKAYEQDNDIVTTLEEGSVIITSSDKLELANSYLLEPGEQVSYNKKENHIKKLNVNPLHFISWKDNKLIFLNMDLRELLVLMERKYDVNIKVKEQDILDYHYSGTIKNETVLEMLDIIKYTLPLDYKIDEQTIILFKSK